MGFRWFALLFVSALTAAANCYAWATTGSPTIAPILVSEDICSGGHVALVTGGSRGIGRQVAYSLASPPHHRSAMGNETSNYITHIICVSSTLAGCAKTVEFINDHYPLPLGCTKRERASAYSADVSDPEEVKKMLGKLIEKFGKIDILVNNAGITRDKLLMSMSVEDWRSVISTNLDSVFYLTRGVLRSMMSQKWGRIVNMASVVGLGGNIGQTSYAASKAALIGFSKSVAKEVGAQRITVNVIAPGFIQSDMTDKMSAAAKKAILDLVPSGRIGETSEISELVKFLVSDDASFITGSTLVVDGGFMTGMA